MHSRELYIPARLYEKNLSSDPQRQVSRALVSSVKCNERNRFILLAVPSLQERTGGFSRFFIGPLISSESPSLRFQRQEAIELR